MNLIHHPRRHNNLILITFGGKQFFSRNSLLLMCVAVNSTAVLAVGRRLAVSATVCSLAVYRCNDDYDDDDALRITILNVN